MDPTADAIDQTKENIQPLSQGRKTSQFGAALHAQTNADLQREFRKTIENFELKLRTYEGDDPLSPWTDYVSWIEQSFPKGGKEGNLKAVLEKCLTKFKDETRYHQDLRLIKLWIKFIDIRDDPKNRSEIYQMAYNHGIGTSSALFYRFWAYELQCCGDDKAANRIFQMGLDQCAQPIEELERAHRTFLLAVAQRTWGQNVPPPQRPDLQDMRVAMSALRPQGNARHAPNMRVGGASVLRMEPGTLPLAPANANRPHHGGIAVFSDENDCITAPPTKAVHMHSVPTQAVTNKENDLKAGPWTAPARPDHRSSKPADRRSRLQSAVIPRDPFNVHSDTASSEPQHAITKSCNTNALLPRRADEVSSPFAMFEPPNPLERPMYAKDKVYAGGKEFSLEELRALHYFKKVRQDEAQGLVKPKPIVVKFVCTPTKGNLGDAAQKSSTADHAINLVGAGGDSSDPHDSDRNSAARCTQGRSQNLEAKSSIPGETSSRIQSPHIHISRRTDYTRSTIFETKSQTTAIQEANSTNCYDNQFAPDSIMRTSTSNHKIPASGKQLETRSAINSVSTIQVECNDVSLKQNDKSICDPKTIVTPLPSNSAASDTHLIHSAFKEVSAAKTNPHYDLKPSRNTVNENISYSKGGNNSNEVNLKARRKTIHPALAQHRSPVLERKRDISSASDSYASDEPSAFHSQSITVNTKEAMSVMNEMWRDNGAKSLNEVPRQSLCMPSSLTSSPSTSSPLMKKPCMKPEVAFTPFKIFTDDADEKATGPQDLTLNSKMFSATERNNQSTQQFVSRTSNFSAVKYEVYQDAEKEEEEVEEPRLESVLPPMPSIPHVASPGMSSIQLRQMEHLESKENQMPLSCEIPGHEPRDMAGVLEPSLHIPYEPIEPEIEYNTVNCVTQAMTEAFKQQLIASTPFHRHQTSHMYNVDTSLCSPEGADHQRSAEPLIDQPRQTEPSLTVPQVFNSQAACNLSIIMEGSKESASSNSRSSSSSGANTRRLTFGTSHWSTNSTTTETQTRKSRGPQPQETLAVIEEIYKEYDSSNASSKTSDKPDASIMKAEVFNMNQFESPKPTKFSVYEEANNSLLDKLPTQNQHTDVYKGDRFDIDVFNSPGDNCVRYAGVKPNVQGKFFVSQESDSVSYVHADSRSKFSVTLEEQKENVRYYYNDKDEGNDYDEESLHDLKVDNDQPGEFSIRNNKEVGESVAALSTSICQLSCDDRQDVDPFNVELISELLSRVDVPSDNYTRVDRSVPSGFKAGNTLTIDSYVYDLLGLLGKGSYAKVLKAINEAGEYKALKVQKPAWVWELYVTNEIQRRLSDKTMLLAFMRVDRCFEFNNGSVLISDLAQYGTVLEVASMMRTMPQTREIEPLSIYWTIEMLRIIENLHACSIIHADVKPDNFVLRLLPTAHATEPSLQLIDFGRSIDLSLFPAGTTFEQVVTTKGFQCVEMQTGRPWTYQTDLYGLASTVHCLLFGDYMNVKCVDGKWNISKKIPRYFNESLWNKFFSELLNIESCKKMPNLKVIRQAFEQVWDQTPRHNCFSFFANIMRNHQPLKRH